MSGICGILHFKEKQVDSALLKKMTNVMKHRGPDDEGYYFGYNNRVGLGVRRLSVIDLETGHQPVHNEDKTVWVVKSGFISNFADLRTELQSKGHTFYSKSDTEVIVHLYEEYGDSCVEHLCGMYAVALWDERNKRLFTARDPIGGKSLYYTFHNNTLLFASEIKSILEYPDFKPEINPEAIHLYLTYQYVPGPGTIWREVNRIPPASILVCDGTGKIETKKYWNLDFTQKTKLTFKDACEHIRYMLTESTKACMRADVPVGAFLSGGFDSSIVVGLMSRNSTGPVKTFSIGFEDEDFSELNYADIAAKHFHTDHHRFILKPEYVNNLPKIARHYDQPFADSSALPSYYVSQVTKQHVGVALNGDGGDENFAGYLRYKAMKGSRYFSFPFRLIGKKATEKIVSILPQVETTKAKGMFKHMHRLFSALSEPIERRNVLWHSFFTEEIKRRIYSDDMKSRMEGNDAYKFLSDVFNHVPAEDIIDKTICTDIMTYLPECLVIKMETASMANSLEARAPFLDHKIMEFTSSLPSSWKLHGLTPKYILKKTFKDILPGEIFSRGKKGFGIPLGKWFRNDLKDYLQDTILSNRAVNRGYFNKKSLEELVHEHTSGCRDHGYRLWALLMLELWHKAFVDRT
jgi:asparagine synthase (glutamine-hydrolysing)